MNFDSSGAQYLRRLKQDLEPPQGLPAPAATTAPAESPTPPSERRQSPRYKCEGSAEFRVEGSDVRTWGTFTDLSLGGCYVEMKATFPVGAMVDLALELNGVRAQVKGEVRISYPFLGIGIAFREVTPENQLRLEEMVYSLPPFTATVPELHSEPVSEHAALPIIMNAGAVLQALADFFEGHISLPTSV